MPRLTKKTREVHQTSSHAENPTEQFIRVRMKALEIPPVKDGVVIGKSAPIGVEAMMRALGLMSTERFVRLKIPGDSVVADAIVREAVLRKMKEKRMREFILRRVKPLMGPHELLMLNMEIEVVVEDSF
jgi:hypothetical protein